MLCDDWNHRSVEKPGSGSSLLKDDVHTVWLFFCSSSYSGALWPRHSFPTRQAWSSPQHFFIFFTRPQESWIWELDLDYWLRRTSERQCHTTDIDAPRLSAVIWNKQPASKMIFRTVFCQWLVQGRKAKQWCFNVTIEAPNPEMSGLSYRDK